MATYEALRQAIDTLIKANGNKEITGDILNNVLNTMLTALSANYQFRGEAKPDTAPGQPLQNVFYFAYDAGTYTNFGNITLPLGISTLSWDGTQWTADTIYQVDTAPSQGSANLITSGAVWNALSRVFTSGKMYEGVATPSTVPAALDGVRKFYIATQAGTYEHFFSNGDIPIVLPNDGLWIISSVTGEDDDDWFAERVIDFDDEPTAGSDNLVKSGGVDLLGNRFKKTLFINKTNVNAKSGYVSQDGIQPAISGSKYIYINLKNADYIYLSWNAPFALPAVFSYVFDSSFNMIVPSKNVSGIDSGKLQLYGLDGIYINLFDIDSTSFQIDFFDKFEVCDNTDMRFKFNGFINVANGEFAPSQSDWWTTDFIPVSVGDTVRIASNAGTLPIAFVYDAEKNYLPNLLPQTGQNFDTVDYVIPNDVCYIRVCSYGYSYQSYVQITSRANSVREIANKALNSVIPDDSIIDETAFTFAGFIDYRTGQIVTHSSTHSTDFIELKEYNRLDVNILIDGYGCIAFYTDNDESKYSGIYVQTSQENTRKTIKVPYGVKYVRFTCYDSFTPSVKMWKASNHWEGMKAVVYGTSVDAGYSKSSKENNRNLLGVYSYECAAFEKLGIKYQNYAVPSGHLTGSGDLAFIDNTTTINYNGVDGSICGCNYQNAMLDLIGTENEPDLFVFSHNINDAARKEYCHLEDDDVQDYNSLDTDTFVGAYNFILKKLFEAKPTARVVLVTHYSNDLGIDASGVDMCRYTNEVIEKIAEKWDIPCIKMHRKCGIINNGFVANTRSYLWDDSHPAHYIPENDTPLLLEKMAYMFAKEIEMLA